MTTGNDPHFHVTVTTPSGTDLLIPIALDVREGVSELFELRLDCLVERNRADEILDLIGASISVESRAPDSGEQPRYWHGLATHVVAMGDNADHRAVEIVVRPEHWMLTRNRHYNVFNQHSVVETLEKALAGHAVKYQVHETYPVRNYTVQYGESDYDFACRLMEDHGLFFHFASNAKRSEMVVRDRSPSSAPITGADEIAYDVLAGGTRDEARVWGWRTEQELAAAKTVHRDRVFQMPSTRLEASSDLSETVVVGTRAVPLRSAVNRQVEVHEYPGGCAKWFDDVSPSGGDQADQFNQLFDEQDRQARRRLQQRAHECLTIRGESDCSRLVPGFSFRLKGSGSADGAYLLTRVEHSIRLTPPGSQAAASTERAYVNRLTCLPLATPYVPPRTVARPVISGPQTATVVGASEDEIFTDKHGRVQVRFPWLAEDDSVNSNSCWMRVVTQSAGKGWGMVTLPRVGQEVVVEFLDGDPDCPLVTGCVYNTERTHPVSMPDAMTGSLIKTQTYQGDSDEFHGLLMQDQSGSELFQVRSQKDMLLECKNDHTLTVPNQRVQNIGGDSITTTGGLSITSSGSGSGSGDMGSGSGGDSDGRDSSSDSGSSDGRGGSGSSSGSSVWDSWGGITVDAPTFNWEIDTNYGVSTTNEIGASFRCRTLMNSDTAIDPFNVLSTASSMVSSSLSSFISTASTLTTGLLGNSNVYHCNDVAVFLGTRTEIDTGGVTHMNVADANSWSSSILQTAYLALATIHALAQIAKALIPDILRNDTSTMKLVMEILEGVTISLRWIMYWVAYWGIKVKQAADAAEDAINSATYYSTVLVTDGDASDVVLNVATAQAADAIGILEESTTSMRRLVPGTYAVDCADYVLRVVDDEGLLRLESKYQMQAVADNAIHLEATNGSVDITANTIQLTNNQGTLYAPTIQVTDDEVTLACDPDAFTENRITMETNGITLNGVDSSSIELGSNSLDLDVGGGTGAAIEMSDTELKLSVGTDTWIKLSADGIEMSGAAVTVTGDNSISLNAPAISATG